MQPNVCEFKCARVDGASSGAFLLDDTTIQKYMHSSYEASVTYVRVHHLNHTATNDPTSCNAR